MIVLEDIDSTDEYSLIDAKCDLTVIREESVINNIIVRSHGEWKRYYKFFCESQSTAAVKIGLDVLCCPLVSETTQWGFFPQKYC